MRDLKFDLIYKGDTGFHHKKYHISEIGKGLGKICDFHNVMAFVAWRQYTGLKDKNDVEIYEGDVCSYTCKIQQWARAVDMFGVEPQNDFQVVEDEYEIKFIGEVRILISKGVVLANCSVFKDSELQEEKRPYKDLKCSNTRVEVIGNIYE